MWYIKLCFTCLHLDIFFSAYVFSLKSKQNQHLSDITTEQINICFASTLLCFYSDLLLLVQLAIILVRGKIIHTPPPYHGWFSDSQVFALCPPLLKMSVQLPSYLGCFITLSSQFFNLHKSQVVFLGTGEHLQEAQSTNASLSALGDVVYALSKGNDFILYRNSTLTIIGTLSKDDERRGRGRTGSNFERKHVSTHVRFCPR